MRRGCWGRGSRTKGAGQGGTRPFQTYRWDPGHGCGRGGRNPLPSETEEGAPGHIRSRHCGSNLILPENQDNAPPTLLVSAAGAPGTQRSSHCGGSHVKKGHRKSPPNGHLTSTSHGKEVGTQTASTSTGRGREVGTQTKSASTGRGREARLQTCSGPPHQGSVTEVTIRPSSEGNKNRTVQAEETQEFSQHLASLLQGLDYLRSQEWARAPISDPWLPPPCPEHRLRTIYQLGTKAQAPASIPNTRPHPLEATGITLLQYIPPQGSPAGSRQEVQVPSQVLAHLLCRTPMQGPAMPSSPHGSRVRADQPSPTTSHQAAGGSLLLHPTTQQQDATLSCIKPWPQLATLSCTQPRQYKAILSSVMPCQQEATFSCVHPRQQEATFFCVQQRQQGAIVSCVRPRKQEATFSCTQPPGSRGQPSPAFSHMAA